MAQTLKERYRKKQLQALREQLIITDAQLLREERATRLIVEALDQQDLDVVSGLIDKLNKVKTYGVKSLNAGIEQAQAELNKYTAGGPLSKAWSTLKTKVGIDNPVVKVTTLVSALEKGFGQLPQILKNSGIDLKNVNAENETLASAITRQAIDKNQQASQKTGLEQQKQKGPLPVAKEDDEGVGSTSVSATNSGPPTISTGDIEATHKANTDPKTQERIKTVVAQLQKALSPSGVFGVFKKVPYVDTQALANDLMNTPLKNFAGLVKTVNSGAKAAQVAADMKDVVTGAGGAETKGTAPSGEAAPSGGAQTSTSSTPPTATSNTKPAGETPPTPRGGGAPQGQQQAPHQNNDFVSKVVKGSGADQAAAQRVLQYLNAHGLLNNKQVASH